MKDYHINIFYSEEDGGYIADVPDLKVCSAFGVPPKKLCGGIHRSTRSGRLEVVTSLACAW